MYVGKVIKIGIKCYLKYVFLNICVVEVKIIWIFMN